MLFTLNIVSSEYASNVLFCIFILSLFIKCLLQAKSKNNANNGIDALPVVALNCAVITNNCNMHPLFRKSVLKKKNILQMYILVDNLLENEFENKMTQTCIHNCCVIFEILKQNN